MSRLRPFFSYFGAKWRLAPKYPAPLHDTIVEPFAGSACYALCYPTKKVVLVEKNPNVAAVWRFLIRTTADEVRALPLVPPDCEDVRQLGIADPGAEMLVRFWMCRTGCASPPTRPNAWMRRHADGYPGSFWGERTRERVASQVGTVKHWQLVEGDYSQAPDATATWFVDPPYQVAGRSYAEGADRIDYQELGEWCRQRRGQVVACENDGASWLPFEPFAETVGVSLKNGSKKRSKEVIWNRR